LVIILIIALVTIAAGSCSHRYYSNYNGKVTKGFSKPPRDISKTPEKNLSFRRANKH